MDGIPSLRDTVTRYNLAARKSLGQHFLLDSNLTDKIARSAGDLSQGTVMEIGPGPGGLTRSLLNAGAQHVIAIEKDERCIDALQPLVQEAKGRLILLPQDALNVDLPTLGTAPRKIVANLPYNISTALLLHWLPHIQKFESLTLMFQKEVADRLIAHPRTKAYGRLSVMTQWVAEVYPLFHLPPSAFVPPPKVISTVVHLRPRQLTLENPSWEAMERLTSAAFGQRRKMLRSSLSSLWGSKTSEHLERAGIAPTLRAEDLTVEQFCHLAKMWMESTG